MFRLAFRREGFKGVGFIIGTISELRRFVAMDGVTIEPNPYNPKL